jgi:hypothetical protein
MPLTNIIQAGDYAVLLADIIGTAKFYNEKALYAFNGYKDLITVKLEKLGFMGNKPVLIGVKREKYYEIC